MSVGSKTGDQLKCIVCDKQIRVLDDWCLDDAAFIVLNAQFGSRFDMDTGEAVICDGCVEKKRSYFEGYRNRVDSHQLTAEQLSELAKPRTKKVIEYAFDEAKQLTHNYVGTEHLLLGLLRESEGVAATVLAGLGVAIDTAREHVKTLLGVGAGGSTRIAEDALRSWSATLHIRAEPKAISEAVKGVVDALTGLPNDTAACVLRAAGVLLGIAETD